MSMVGVDDMAVGAWTLAIDFGARTTRAAVAYHARGRIAVVAEVPSVVRWHVSDTEAPRGELRAGNPWATLRASRWRGEVAPKGRVGDARLALGAVDVGVVDAVAAILRVLTEKVVTDQGGLPPDAIVLTHPAWWSEQQLGQFKAAAEKGGVADAELVPEPVAIAGYFARDEIAPGERIAVLDMGGSAFGAAVVQRTRGGFDVVGEPGRLRTLGGDDFEDRVYQFLGGQLSPTDWDHLQHASEPEWRKADHELRSNASFAVALFSWDPNRSEHPIRVPAPVSHTLLLTRGELLHLIAEDVKATVNMLADTVLGAGLDPARLDGIWLAGGSSELPLLSTLIAERFGRRPIGATSPALVVALGAARAALGAAHGRLSDQGTFRPAQLMPSVSRDRELDAVLIMDHGQWASRDRGAWHSGCRWSGDASRDFLAITEHAEIFRLLDEADAALGNDR
jgi:molecular chaperone DnaK (HSP70)